MREFLIWYQSGDDPKNRDYERIEAPNADIAVELFLAIVAPHVRVIAVYGRIL